MERQLVEVCASQIVASLAADSCVTTLTICNNNLSNQEVARIAEALESNTTVTTLRLGGNNFSITSAKRIAKALERNTAVTTLWLGCFRGLDLFGVGTYFGQKHAQWIVMGLAKNRRVTTLVLANNTVNHGLEEHVAAAFERNNAMTELQYAGSQRTFGADATQRIAAAIQKNKTAVVLTAAPEWGSQDRMTITFTAMSGHPVASVDISCLQKFTALVSAVSSKVDHLGSLRFILPDGKLLADPSGALTLGEMLRGDELGA